MQAGRTARAVGIAGGVREYYRAGIDEESWSSNLIRRILCRRWLPGVLEGRLRVPLG
jgi:hypothetical protein